MKHIEIKLWNPTTNLQKKINVYTVIHKICFFSLLLVYRKRELWCWKMSTVDNKFALLQQFTEPRQVS